MPAVAESGHVLCGRGNLGKADAHAYRPGGEDRAAFLSELAARVVTPGPQPVRAVDGVAGESAGADCDEGHPLRYLHGYGDSRADLRAITELAPVVVTPGPHRAVGQDGDGLAVLGPAPALEHLTHRPIKGDF